MADPFALSTFNWCQDVDHYCGEKTCGRLLAHKPYRKPSMPTNTLHEHHLWQAGEEESMMGQRLVGGDEASIVSRPMPGSNSMTSLPQYTSAAPPVSYQQPHRSEVPAAQKLLRLDATDDNNHISNATHGTPEVVAWPSAPGHEPVGAHADDEQMDQSIAGREDERRSDGKEATAREAVLA